VFPPEDFKSESGRFRNLSDGKGFGGFPCPQRTCKPYEVYETYEVFGPLRDRIGTVWGHHFRLIEHWPELLGLPAGDKELGSKRHHQKTAGQDSSNAVLRNLRGRN
jgi:hypothetical protein